MTHPIALAERRHILAYIDRHATRVATAQTRGRLSVDQRRMIVRQLRVVIGDVEAGLHREEVGGGL